MVLTLELSRPQGCLVAAHPSYRRTPLLSTGQMFSFYGGEGRIQAAPWTLRLCPPCSETALPLITEAQQSCLRVGALLPMPLLSKLQAALPPKELTGQCGLLHREKEGGICVTSGKGLVLGRAAR